MGVDSTAGNNDVPSGKKVKVTGILLNYRGTRMIRANSITSQSTGNAIPKPLAILHRACGSGPYATDAGVPDFYGGLDTTGMLVTVVGKVLAVYNDGINYWAYIDDGTHVPADNGEFGLKVYDSADLLLASTPDPVGRTLWATGFILNDPEKDPPIFGSFTGNTVRSLRPKPDLADALRWLD